jgi:hypothetical protein
MNNVLHGWNINNIKISPGCTTVRAVTNYLIFAPIYTVSLVWRELDARCVFLGGRDYERCCLVHTASVSCH